MAIQKISRSSFGIKQLRYPVPNLNSFQLDSFKLFFEEELAQILKEFSGVEDPVSGRFKVSFGPKFYLENFDPDEYANLLNGSTFGADLFIDVTVELASKEKKKQRVFVGKIPMMNRRGSFIVNGTQKVVAGQLVKSPGVLFKREAVKGVAY